MMELIKKYQSAWTLAFAIVGLAALVLPLLGWNMRLAFWLPIAVVCLLIAIAFARQRTGLLWALLLVATFLPWGKQFDLGTPIARHVFIPTYVADIFLAILLLWTVWDILRQKMSWRFSWVDAGFALCVGATLASWYNAPDTAAVWGRVVEWGRAWLCFSIARLRLGDEVEQKWFVNSVLILLVLNGLFVLFSAITGNNFGFWDKPGGGILVLFAGRMALYRAGSTVEPNVISQIASLWLPLVVAGLFIAHKRNLLIWLALAGCVAALLLSFSRAGWLTAVAGVGLVSFLGIMAKPLTSTRKIVTVIVFTLLLLAVVSAGIFIVGELSESSVTSAVSRLGMSQTALKMWNDHPLLGIGAGNYLDLVLIYTPVTALFFPVHDLYLETLAETGLLGICALAVLIFTLMIPTAIRANRLLRGGGWMTAAVWCGLVGMWLRLAVTMSFHDPTVLSHLFLAGGLVMALCYSQAGGKEKVKP
jgi:O-antigen ligase